MLRMRSDPGRVRGGGRHQGEHQQARSLAKDGDPPLSLLADTTMDSLILVT
jgi:hypothetical protein